MQLTDLKTPCAIVDLDRLERNAAAMAERVRRLGVRLRPHVKTHKCVEAARIQTAGQFGGITVSTLAEARAFADAGFADITYAVPPALDRLDELADLHRRVDRFTLLVDHPHTLAELERLAGARGLRFSTLVKVDCGLHRVGVDPEDAAAVDLAAALHGSPHLELVGVLTHAGHAYRCEDREEVRQVAIHERHVVVSFAERLRASGVGVGEISLGSTPTVVAADDLSGVTEVRPGNYLFFDVFQAAIGSCHLHEAAFSVLASVIGVYPARNEFVVDAGALALSKDPGPVHIDPGCGYGAVVTPDEQRLLPTLTVRTLSQEHGVIASDDPLEERWRPGELVRILPNHSCLTAACFDRFHVVRGSEVVDEWRPARGW